MNFPHKLRIDVYLQSFTWIDYNGASDTIINVIYDRTYYGKTLSVSGIIGADVVTMTFSATENVSSTFTSGNQIANSTPYHFSAILARDAGYTVTITGVSNSYNDYSLPQTDISRSFTIQRKTVGISFDYSSPFTYDRNNHTVEATISLTKQKYVPSHTMLVGH